MLDRNAIVDTQTAEKSKEQKQSNSDVNKNESIAVSRPLGGGSDGKGVRIYIDGCWDIMHSGHYNAIRQAKALGDILIVGVHSDEEIARNKREPVMNNEERMAMVKACKWTDETVFDVPYSPSVELIDSPQVRADFVAHGDDIPHDANGKSAYEAVLNRLKIFKRTPGVSTTVLIDRLLLAVEYEKKIAITNNNNNNNNKQNKNKHKKKKKEVEEEETNVVSWSQFLATSHRLSAFSNHRVPQPDDIVIYIDGSWDLFHPGHVAALKKAKSLGTFLYVGLYDDTTIREKQGKYWPMMSLQERTLNVLSCRYVDEVVIGCPWIVSRDMVNVLNIRVLAIAENVMLCPEDMERYKAMTDLITVEKLTNLESNLKTQDLIQRILKDHEKYSKQNATRVKRELKYMNEREYVKEK